MKILISDNLSKVGVDLLRRGERFQVDVNTGLKPEELKRIIGDYDALIVRSETKVTAEIIGAADNLKVIGRAGTGVDNIDVPAATARGIVVMNAAGGNRPTANSGSARTCTLPVSTPKAQTIASHRAKPRALKSAPTHFAARIFDGASFKRDPRSSPR